MCWTVVCERHALVLHWSIHSAFMGSFRYHAGSWKLEQSLHWLSRTWVTAHAWVSWGSVCAQLEAWTVFTLDGSNIVDSTRFCFLRLCVRNWKLWKSWRIFAFVESDKELHSTSLEGGRISLQQAHLEDKKTSCWYLENVGALISELLRPLRSWGFEVWGSY